MQNIQEIIKRDQDKNVYTGQKPPSKTREEIWANENDHL
jgi:hypothetical protein